jgi:tRNA A37 threonylcarbamoyladenosine dehydratase
MNVIDLDGLKFSNINKKVYAMIKNVSAATSDNYPENLGQTIIINAPFLFHGVWSMVKSFLDERTVKKISILGGSY